MKKLKEIRKQLGLTQKELADRANISPPYLSALENGIKKNPTLQVLQDLSKALGVETKDLY